MKTLIILPLAVVAGCLARQSSEKSTENGFTTGAYHPSGSFNEYWYNGEAELSSFDLEQARYGQMRKGTATLIFVTEHLDPKTLVKTEKNTDSAVPVIKLNATRKFLTGIYPYSLMTSVFTPVGRKVNGHTLKETFTAQEWCGHQFQMVKWNGQGYEGQLNSYFAGEADQDFTLDGQLLEDEIWNLVRMGPGYLPEGEVTLIPSFTHLRLAHIDHRPYQANAQLTEADSLFDGTEDVLKFMLDYTELDRSLVIYFEAAFPHRILRWEEQVKSGLDENAKTLTTVATRKQTIKLDYWNKNSNADTIYRQQLGY